MCLRPCNVRVPKYSDIRPAKRIIESTRYPNFLPPHLTSYPRQRFSLPPPPQRLLLDFFYGSYYLAFFLIMDGF
jgi:hypothetical protein